MSYDDEPPWTVLVVSVKWVSKYICCVYVCMWICSCGYVLVDVCVFVFTAAPKLYNDLII